MREERLWEITSTISMMNGGLVVFGYFNSLANDEQKWILNRINKDTKYQKEKDVISKIILFSKNYVEEHGKIENNSEILNFGYKEGNYDNYFEKSGYSNNYLDNYMFMDEDVKSVKK